MIAVLLVFMSIGNTVVAIALVVLAVPPILTNAYVGVSEVDHETVEAARGMGMTEWQILRRVELPLATPLLFAGIRTAVVFVVASATIAAIAGGGGLGDIIVNQAAYRIEGVIAASLVVSRARLRRRRRRRRRAAARHAEAAAAGATPRTYCWSTDAGEPKPSV